MRLIPCKGTAALLAAALLAAGGCGGDDEPEKEGTTGQDTATSTTDRPTTTMQPPAETSPTTGTAPASPEDEPGGAGDEEEARSPAFFTGRGGRIRPRLVRVPPFLAIRVELRSADGRVYGLRFGRKSVVVGRRIESAATELDGLRPGRSISGTPVGGGSPVRIEASAEPGP